MLYQLNKLNTWKDLHLYPHPHKRQADTYNYVILFTIIYGLFYFLYNSVLNYFNLDSIYTSAAHSLLIGIFLINIDIYVKHLYEFYVK